MEKQQEDILMKARSYRGVITSGLRLYTANFRKIFKATSFYTLIYMLMTAVLGALFTTRLLPVGLQMAALPQYKWQIAGNHIPLIIFSLVLGILALAKFFIILDIVLEKLKEHKDRGIILTPPKWFSLSFKPHFMGIMFKAASRHWLLSLGILLIGLLVITPICLFVCLPAIILMVASVQAHIGTLMGDPLGMPSYLSWMAGGTWLLAAFLQIYITLSLLFIGYYAYGSAETQKKEREQQKLNIPS